MAKTTQKQRVLNHLNECETITSWEAIKEYGCTRLADVIFRLKSEYVITTEMISKNNRFGEPIRFDKYRIVGKKTLN